MDFCLWPFDPEPTLVPQFSKTICGLNLRAERFQIQIWNILSLGWHISNGWSLANSWKISAPHQASGINIYSTTSSHQKMQWQLSFTLWSFWWWLNQPIWTYAQVKLDHFPMISGWTWNKNIWSSTTRDPFLMGRPLKIQLPPIDRFNSLRKGFGMSSRGQQLSVGICHANLHNFRPLILN